MGASKSPFICGDVWALLHSPNIILHTYVPQFESFFVQPPISATLPPLALAKCRRPKHSRTHAIICGEHEFSISGHRPTMVQKNTDVNSKLVPIMWFSLQFYLGEDKNFIEIQFLSLAIDIYFNGALKRFHLQKCEPLRI